MTMEEDATLHVNLARGVWEIVEFEIALLSFLLYGHPGDT